MTKHDYAPAISPSEADGGVAERFLAFLDADDRTAFEQLLTVPNAVSLGSFAAVCHGVKHMGTLEGLQHIVAGRLGDLADGGLARLLNQSTQAGAMLDAALDKAAIALIMAKAWQCGAVPREQIATIAATHAINLAVTSLAAYRHPHTTWRPSRAGKYGMALHNLSLISHTAGYTAEQMLQRGSLHGFSPEQLTQAAGAARTLGKVAFWAAQPFSATATGSYMKRLWRP